ncbi:hypothetical protein C5C36_15535 [Rathayibacter sp. AY1G1]|jgi:hypothetical protein|nr:hypothetical protein C5C30_14155 [Rathayibacter sp. AY2B5]PPG50759.1 hypothetical protein C5C24_09075 [Rathayibacter sp. AY2B3]PPH08951.1 hypothetical protein C5C36_15535 [Rathayibacter sp. AY1G1]PPH29032.1 hypothetical protein C5C94_12435 [Rathayibacter sp. AY1C3]PPH86461.1 hypothetical protein C5C64_14900 [Rathayibacter sp. AY1D3]PPI26839.1 hypothetical protein C5D44_05675 [Rathayibacter sp. AY1B5]
MAMEITDDVERAEWLGLRMQRERSWARVGSVAGYGFEAYARVLHPRPDGDDIWERQRWADVAATAGKVMHPLVQWERLLGRDEPRGGTSDVGRLDPQVLAALAPILSSATTTPGDALAAYWVGGTGQNLLGRPVSIDRYDYILAATSMAELAEPGWGPEIGLRGEEAPQLLWPEDHAWVLATEIDWDSTIVAGSHTLVSAILTDGRFEAFPVDEDSDLSWNGDTINRPKVQEPS